MGLVPLPDAGAWGPETPPGREPSSWSWPTGVLPLPMPQAQVARWPRQGQAGAADALAESDGAAHAPAGAGFCLWGIPAGGGERGREARVQGGLLVGAAWHRFG